MIVIVLSGLAAVSCSQDNIFQIISNETAPQKPRIEGAPTNMVVFERQYPGIDKPVPIMYVASGRLHWYAKAPGADVPQWDSSVYPIPRPKGKIISLAVAKDAYGGGRLYALCRDGHGVNAILRYIESQFTPGEDWKTISSDRTEIQSIYADPETSRLFAGAGRSSYDILYLDDSDTLRLLKANTSIFSGAVYKDTIYYLSTRGDGTRGGIFQISEADLAANIINDDTVIQLADNTAVEEKDKKPHGTFMSLTKLNDTIIAVERDRGALYEVQNGSFTRMQYADTGDWITFRKNASGSGFPYATQAHILWEDPERGIKLFINGIQSELFSSTSSSHTYGYVEFELDASGASITAIRDSNRSNLLSLLDGNQERYKASLGKHPINHLFQAPDTIDPNLTFFASTQTEGLWSYRNRTDNGGWQWNAEE